MISSYIPVPLNDLIVEQHGTFCVLVHPERPLWMVTTRSGLEVARLCDGKRSVQEIAAIVASRYGRALSLALSDVSAYLEQLERSGLLSDREVEVSGPSRIERLHINVTDRCNLRCIHCAVTDGCSDFDGLTTHRILRLMDELAESGGGTVALSGGEPMLREDCLKLIEYGAGRVNLNLATNGTLIDEEIARRLADLPVNVQISMDAASAERHDAVRGDGAFDRTLRGIGLLVRFGAQERVALCATLMKPMMDEVPRILELALECGVPSVRFIPVQKMGRAAVRWTKLRPSAEEYAAAYRYLYFDLPERFREVRIRSGFQGFELHRSEGDEGCRIGHLLAVDSDGGLYPCPLLMRPEFRIGQVTEMSLEDAARSPVLTELGEACASRWRSIEACQGCTWRTLCQAGCPGSIFLEKGSFWRTDDLCALRKDLYRRTLLDMAEAKLSAEEDEN